MASDGSKSFERLAELEVYRHLGSAVPQAYCRYNGKEVVCEFGALEGGHITRWIALTTFTRDLPDGKTQVISTGEIAKVN